MSERNFISSGLIYKYHNFISAVPHLGTLEGRLPGGGIRTLKPAELAQVLSPAALMMAALVM